MANPLAGLSGYGTAEVRTEPLPRRIAIQVAAEVIRVGRAAGYEVEPIWGIAAQRIVDAAEGNGLEPSKPTWPPARANWPAGDRRSCRT